MAKSVRDENYLDVCTFGDSRLIVCCPSDAGDRPKGGRRPAIGDEGGGGRRPAVGGRPVGGGRRPAVIVGDSVPTNAVGEVESDGSVDEGGAGRPPDFLLTTTPAEVEADLSADDRPKDNAEKTPDFLFTTIPAEVPADTSSVDGRPDETATPAATPATTSGSPPDVQATTSGETDPPLDTRVGNGASSTGVAVGSTLRPWPFFRFRTQPNRHGRNTPRKTQNLLLLHATHVRSATRILSLRPYPRTVIYIPRVFPPITRFRSFFGLPIRPFPSFLYLLSTHPNRRLNHIHTHFPGRCAQTPSHIFIPNSIRPTHTPHPPRALAILICATFVFTIDCPKLAIVPQHSYKTSLFITKHSCCCFSPLHPNLILFAAYPTISSLSQKMYFKIFHLISLPPCITFRSLPIPSTLFSNLKLKNSVLFLIYFSPILFLLVCLLTHLNSRQTRTNK